jgi:hypothetical protein
MMKYYHEEVHDKVQLHHPQPRGVDVLDKVDILREEWLD